MKRMSARAIGFGIASLLLVNAAVAVLAKHAITLDDVLGMEHLDQVAVSPDGAWVAASIQRPAKAGEVYGRTAYETDPSRNDIWLISRQTHERRNITQGENLAAGFWCASWSPDGQRLAMLSTRPEQGEPRGGDNVRLYIWDRDSGQMTRLGNVAMMTQTRYGGAAHRLDLRGGADHGSVTHTCGNNDENAPFLWLDDHRLLAVTLPKGQVSGLIDEASRQFGVVARDARALHEGSIATGEAVGSGDARMPPSEDLRAEIQIIDAVTQQWTRLSSVPAYPFWGDLSLTVSPDGKQLAILAPVQTFAPVAGRRIPHAEDGDWQVEKTLATVELHAGAAIRWVKMPAATPYPLELYGWSPDNRRLALRARRDAYDMKPALLVLDAVSGRAAPVGTVSLDQPAAGSIVPHDAPLLWLDNTHMLARLHAPDGQRLDWSRIGLDGKVTNLTGSWKDTPSALRRLSDGRLTTIAGRAVVTLDPRSGHATMLADLGADGGSLMWPDDPVVGADRLLVETPQADDAQAVRQIALSGAQHATIPLPATAIPVRAARGRLLWQEGDETGLFLKEGDTVTGKIDTTLPLDTSLAAIDWGRTMLFDYTTTDGQSVTGGAILPPDYQPGRRYPTLVWVYEGHRVEKHGDYFLDPQMPGLYNLQLYAAKGYVVLIPSMPLLHTPERKDVYAAVTNGVMPAIDVLVKKGIADPDRLGVFGQSYGGYSVYALVSQTGRFKASVALAGITDLAGYVDQFDPQGRGYPGIAHEKSANPVIADQFGLHGPPTSDREGYERNSPLLHVDRVHTPLLMIHGTDDIRGAVTQAEQFFHALYAQGETARLVRYDGENHSLAQSPANIRDIFGEIVSWFDHYVKAGG